MRSWFKKKSKGPIWESRDGRKQYISEMQYAHVFNVLCLLESRVNESPWIRDSHIYKAIKERYETLHNATTDK